MKKVLIMPLMLVLAFTMNIVVSAASSTYILSEAGFKITIPSIYSVITRDTPANDPIFNAYGTTKSEVMDMFNERNIYLNAVSTDYNEEIILTVDKVDLSDFNLLSDAEMEFVTSTIENMGSDIGASVLKKEIYQHSKAKFVKVLMFDSINSMNVLQYYTAYNNKAICLTLRSQTGKISSAQENTFKSIIDSIVFDTNPSVLKEKKETASLKYTDKDTGVSFTVPENWVEEEFLTEVQHLDAKFSSTKEPGIFICYMSEDVWEQMPASERVGYSRADFNNSVFTKADFAEMFGTTTDKVSFLEYNGNGYYLCEMTGSSEVYDFAVTMTQAVHIDNGWMYMFQIHGTSQGEYFDDFEELLRSVEYPSVYKNNSSLITSDSDVNSSSGASLDSEDTGMYIFAVFTLIILVIAIIVAVVFLRKRKATDMQAYGQDSQNNVAESTYYKASIYCTNCGQALPSDSGFCHICGTKVYREDDVQ